MSFLLMQTSKGVYAVKKRGEVVPEPENTPPTITNWSPPLVAYVGVEYTYQCTATDPDEGDVLTWSLTQNPTGMEINSATGLITWTPTEHQEGEHNVTVRVADTKDGFDEEGPFEIAVSVYANTAPSFTPITYLNHTYDEVLAFDETYADLEYPLNYYNILRATDLQGDPLIYSLPTAPAGMTIDTISLWDQDTGEIEWEPDADDIGDHDVLARVTDDGGLYDEGGMNTEEGASTLTVRPASPWPTLPTEYNYPAYSLPTGKTWYAYAAGEAEPWGTVQKNEGENWETDTLQNCLTNAAQGDVIILKAGATYTGQFKLPAKTGEGWLYIVSSEMASLPVEGVRVSPSDAASMPKIRVTTQTHIPLTIDRDVKCVRIVGIEIANEYTGTSHSYHTVIIGNTGSGISEDIILDRCYIHGLLTTPIRNGVAMYDVSKAAIVNCHICEIHGAGESHGIHIVLSLGPVRIENNYIAAAAINVFMGMNPKQAISAQDIVVRGNHLHKPLTWWSAHPDHDPEVHKSWAVKNLLEPKGGERILVEGNVLENNWANWDQSGQAFTITPRSHRIVDMTIRNNIVRYCHSFAQISAADVRIDRLLIENNLFYNQHTSGRSVSFGGQRRKLVNVAIRHNTFNVTHTGGAMLWCGSTLAESAGTWCIDFTDNIGRSNTHQQALAGTNFSNWNAFSYYMRRWRFTHNIMMALESSGQKNFPVTAPGDKPISGPHYFPANIAAIGFSLETMTIDEQPDVDWEPDDVITGQTSGKTCTVVEKLTDTTYNVRGRTGAFTTGEVIGVDDDLDKQADQGTGYPTFVGTTPTEIAHFKLLSTSPYHEAGSDGKDVGADIDAILAAINDP